MGAGSSWDSMRLGFSRGTLAESSYVGSEESLGPEETSRTLFLSEARLVTLAQGFTLSGSLYMRASGKAEPCRARGETEEVGGDERELTRPGVYDWEIAPKPELAAKSHVYIATATTNPT